MPFQIQVNESIITFSIVFQPIVDVELNQVVAVEVLSRVKSGENIESILKQVSLHGNSREFNLALFAEVKNCLCIYLKTYVTYH